MKRIIKYFMFTVVAVAMLSSAAVALAQGGPGGPEGPGRGIGGEVTAIDGATIYVQSPRREEEEAIVTTGSTEFVVNDEAGSLGDIEIGMFVRAEGERADDGAFTATRVVASDEMPQPPDGPGGPGRGPGGPKPPHQDQGQ